MQIIFHVCHQNLSTLLVLPCRHLNKIYLRSCSIHSSRSLVDKFIENLRICAFYDERKFYKTLSSRTKPRLSHGLKIIQLKIRNFIHLRFEIFVRNKAFSWESRKSRVLVIMLHQTRMNWRELLILWI